MGRFRGFRAKLLDDCLPPNWLGRRFLTRYIEEASHHASGLMLDAGCGSKPYFHFFQHRVHAYYGVDLPSSAYRQREAMDAFGSVTALPFRRAVFDTLLCSQVIEHVAETSLLVSEMARVLKPGGVLILSAPQSNALHEEPNDYYRFTKYGLRYLAEKHGFEVLWIKACGGFWVMTGQNMSWYLADYAPRLPKKIGVLWRFLCGVMLLGFAWLDRLFPDQRYVFNWVMLAKKV